MIFLHVRPELVFLTSIELVENQLGWASYPHSKNKGLKESIGKAVRKDVYDLDLVRAFGE